MATPAPNTTSTSTSASSPYSFSSLPSSSASEIVVFPTDSVKQVWEVPHFHLTKRCSLCELQFEPQRDRIIAITSQEDCLTHQQVGLSHLTFPAQTNAIDAFRLAPYLHINRDTVQPKGCRRRDCSPENPRTRYRTQIPTLHLRCYQRLRCLDGSNDMFKRFCWIYQCRTSPFADAPRFLLSSRVSGVTSAAGLVIAPTTNMISWKMSFKIPEDHEKVGLTTVKSWKRNESFAKMRDRDQHLTTIRLTLDSYGICEIERLQEMPRPFTEPKIDNRAFIVVDEWEVRNVFLCLKWSIGRLAIPPRHQGLHIWDTPSPPHLEYNGPGLDGPLTGQQVIDGPVIQGRTTNQVSSGIPDHMPYFIDECTWMLADCSLAGAPETPMSRFFSIDLKSVTGLTFMYGYDRGLYGIHGHTAANPGLQVPSEAPTDMHWVYVPLPPGEEIISIDARVLAMRNGGVHTPNIRIKTKLAGEIHVGPSYMRNASYNVSSDNPHTLFFNRSDDMEGLGTVDMVGAYSDSNHDADEAGLYPLPGLLLNNGHFFEEPPLVDNYSSASLNGVTRVRIYRHGSVEGRFQGMFLDYENGAQRVIGSYRADSILAEDHHNPRVLCTHDNQNIPCIEHTNREQRITFSETHVHEHDCPGWWCGELSWDYQVELHVYKMGGEWTWFQLDYQPVSPPFYTAPSPETVTTYEYASEHQYTEDFQYASENPIHPMYPIE